MLFKQTKCPNCGAYHDQTLKECPYCHKSNELFSLNRLPKDVLFLHPLAQISMFLIGFAYVGMFFGQIIFSLIFAKAPLSSDGKNTAILTASYFLMLIGLIIVPLFTRRKAFADTFKKGQNYFYGIIYATMLFGVASLVLSIVSLMHEALPNVNQEGAEKIIENYPIIALIVLGFVGPICEELTYRVGLYSLLRRINKYLALIVTTIVFALIHFDFTAANIIEELWSLPSYLICGLILTLAYERHGPISSIIAHIAYNVIAIVLILAK